ncbi:zinc-finger associated domain (zf-AD) domain-containing protein [Phthorimaea operculella]|nr:zinc-finger associated domain (zf-AD) domain-containing protein [Phthorimaea operculella]
MNIAVQDYLITKKYNYCSPTVRTLEDYFDILNEIDESCGHGGQEDFFRNEVQQVYRQTFLETFNLCLSSNPCLPQMICKSCIGRLTDAAEFIAMVKESEQYLLNNTDTTSDIEFVNENHKSHKKIQKKNVL